ncbi:calcium/proton exchanger [Cyphellophora europaea CBS 101466]|uniref:Calcium/proton exchanger n=1 Tax=Cyphellophora europaea (strain CBS 101466) TaxID=1220924 RepID=W2SED0_CYPE1|nr:calcium/proton exchanger [Cyphellophora europaea CBS 101466]ETN46975.1 calcium/proton exchanger [Cyphellophora europaea CBS 101466]
MSSARSRPLQRQATIGSPTDTRGPDSAGYFPPISPQVNRGKRPSVGRRASTAKPHRGEQFSVDDDPSEVEEDREVRPPTVSRSQSTRRRRTTFQPPQLPRVDSSREEDEEEAETEPEEPVTPHQPEPQVEEEHDEDVAEETLDEAADGDDDLDLSDAESFTLRDRQLAINQTHPFGIRIWKPALYKKNRSVEKNAEEDIHSSPSQIVSPWLWFFNVLWTLLFGWWLALAAILGAVACFMFAFEKSAAAYGRVFWGISGYLFWPFGKFVRLESDENYAEEDEGEGRSIGEYERWQAGDLEYGRLMFGPTLTHTGSIVGRRRNSIESASEHDSLLERSGRMDRYETDLGTRAKRRLFGRGQWTLGRVIFFVFFYFNLAPLMAVVSLICWFLVFWIPMGRVTWILIHHMRKRPLALGFHADVSHARESSRPSSILLCTYRAVGIKYWKYTVDGTNIFLINFLAVVVFVIFDNFFLREFLKIETWFTSPALLFPLGLVSIIPLAYFIGQAVASISAQSTMGMGAAVNAFFSTVVEVYLYCIALNEGKGRLVEGSVVGSIFAGILFLPGLSMCFGAIKRKTQRFNVQSAGASSTMLLFAVVAAFAPTLFYKIYGSHELICKECSNTFDDERDCRQCYFRQVPAINDQFYTTAVRPFAWAAAVLLFSSYMIGLLFTLRTHASIIWSNEADEKKPITASQTLEISPTDTRRQSMYPSLGQPTAHGSQVSRTNVRNSQLYKKILGQSLKSAGLAPDGDGSGDQTRLGSQVHAIDHAQGELPHKPPPRPNRSGLTTPDPQAEMIPGLTAEENSKLLRRVTELASTAATVAAREATANPRAAAYQATHNKNDKTLRPSGIQRSDTIGAPAAAPAQTEQVAGGHDAPNWSRTKSMVILLGATVLYAAIAEVLVDTVDVVLESSDIDEKFLGITLFALVPNTTEFLNAISFAMNGNIALSMEIGSAYALQVCLLQIPALVLYSALHGRYVDPTSLLDHTFNLIFPQWDMVTTILCVFLLSYICTEGKSNYFKGSILVLTYLVVLLGFYLSGYTDMESMEVNPLDTLALGSSMGLRSGLSGGKEL